MIKIITDADVRKQGEIGEAYLLLLQRRDPPASSAVEALTGSASMDVSENEITSSGIVCHELENLSIQTPENAIESLDQNAS